MRPKRKGHVKSAGMKRKREKMTSKTSVDDMFSMIDDDDSVSYFTVICMTSLESENLLYK